ncbi:cytochrome P450 [Mycena sanguinolenta]|nr:cytochrome P450 [Mycena sanguinolenta]
MDYSTLALLALAILLLRSLQTFFNALQRRLPSPPGPTPYPLVGNFRELPTKLPWLTYTEWGHKYGSDVVHASALGQHVVVVNSVKAANELFEKRSYIYSDRPVVTMIELMGWDFNVGLMPMGDKWRKHRRMFQQHFRRDISRNYRPIQMQKIHLLLQALLSSPQDFREHLKTRAIHYFLPPKANRIFRQVNRSDYHGDEHAVKKLSDSFFPGAVVVNTFPILRYLPSWMPGAGFKRYAADCLEVTNEMRQVPFDYAKHNMRDDVESKTVVARLIEVTKARGRYDEDAIQNVAATAYAAGSDTTVSALASFFIAMAVHPEAQKKAQTEIDTVIGTHRLPEFEDRASLPYVEALFREVMRWRPALPLGVAHASSVDDIYNGYFIPKGTTVLSNIWAMTRDESIYSEPERFNPDRFFTADGKLNDDNTILTFGFGRRICPGRHNAEATVWATFVSVLSTFTIAKGKDADGKEIDIDPVYSDGIVSHPEPFACSITPRSEIAKNLVQGAA